MEIPIRYLILTDQAEQQTRKTFFPCGVMTALKTKI